LQNHPPVGGVKKVVLESILESDGYRQALFFFQTFNTANRFPLREPMGFVLQTVLG